MLNLNPLPSIESLQAKYKKVKGLAFKEAPGLYAFFAGVLALLGYVGWTMYVALEAAGLLISVPVFIAGLWIIGVSYQLGRSALARDLASTDYMNLLAQCTASQVEAALGSDATTALSKLYIERYKLAANPAKNQGK